MSRSRSPKTERPERLGWHRNTARLPASPPPHLTLAESSYQQQSRLLCGRLQALGMDLKGSKALVTGGSRGIGFAAAELLLSLGQART